jgi:hypothetical protein
MHGIVFNYSNHPFIYLALQIIDRLPLSVDTLKSSKLGKIVLKLTKDPPAPGEFFNPSNPLQSRSSTWIVARIEHVLSFVVQYGLPLANLERQKMTCI